MHCQNDGIDIGDGVKGSGFEMKEHLRLGTQLKEDGEGPLGFLIGAP